MDPELCFFEYLPSTKEAAAIRRLRRANGLVHLFSRNRPSKFSTINRKFSKIMQIEAWIHLVMPFLVLFSFSIMLLHISISTSLVIMEESFQTTHALLLLIDSLFLISLLFGNKLRLSQILRSFFISQWALLVANIEMYRGIDFHIWEQDIESRESLVED